jgi:hypothetical protein
MSAIACSIKGNVKENISPSTGRREKFPWLPAPLTIEDARLVSCPVVLGFGLFHLSSFIFLLVATMPIGF